MKYFQTIKNIAFASAVVIGIQACEKLDREDPIGNGGQTVVKLVSGGLAGEIVPGGAGHILTGIDFVPEPQSLDIADVRRDVPNATEMNRSMNIVLQNDTFALRIFNDSLVANGGNALQIMPESWYTLNYATPAPGGTININMAPGELAKPVTITINDATQMDPASTYGFAFSILSADAGGKISVARTMIYEIGAKNKYDGVYNMRGVHNRTPYNFPYETEMHLITTAGNEVAFYFPAAGSLGHPIGTAPGEMSWYGPTMAPKIVFDPETDEITNVYQGYTGGTFVDIYTGPGSGPGYYDAATKTVYVYWRYAQNDLRAFMDTMVYTGSR